MFVRRVREAFVSLLLRTLVILGMLLGDAENPAHTEWQSKGENFRGKYTFGASVLDFVTRVVANFVGSSAKFVPRLMQS